MFKDIEINPEVARLIQRNCLKKQLPFEQELARYVVEAAIVELEPELELIVEADSALAEILPLAGAIAVNDVVINGRHFHVAVLNDDGQVKVKSILIDTDYLKSGTLVVKLNGSSSGRIVGCVDKQQWQVADAKRTANGETFLSFKEQSDFSLSEFFKKIVGEQPTQVKSNVALRADDYLTFIKEPSRLSTDTQKQVISALLTPSIRENVALVAKAKQDEIIHVLRDAAVWHARVEKFSSRLRDKFPSFNPERTKAAVMRVGEKLGGQTEMLEFRKAVLSELTQEALAEKLTGSRKAQITSLIDRISAGASALTAVKQMVKNPLSFDLAEAINKQRQGLISFASATVEEFGLAFKNLALQPAYATHSQTDTVGLDAVNEALILLETAELAEQVRELEL
jgi:hypothetical protein